MVGIAIIQGRMNSSRFPGKTLFPLKGKPSLQHLIDSLLQIFPTNSIYVATSNLPSDDPIADLARSIGIKVFRGDQENVASRFREICKISNEPFFIRLNGDSPLLDYRIVQSVIAKFSNSEDLISTSFKKTFPPGMNVELVNSNTFLMAYCKFSELPHFEHVTKYFYENATKFNIQSVKCDVEDATKCRFSFDTPEDKLRLESLFFALEKPHYCYSLKEKCDLYKTLFIKNQC